MRNYIHLLENEIKEYNKLINEASCRYVTAACEGKYIASMN